MEAGKLLPFRTIRFNAMPNRREANRLVDEIADDYGYCSPSDWQALQAGDKRVLQRFQQRMANLRAIAGESIRTYVGACDCIVPRDFAFSDFVIAVLPATYTAAMRALSSSFCKMLTTIASPEQRAVAYIPSSTSICVRTA